MSLIKCPECAKEISDKAEKCPYCGYSINLIAKTKQKCNNKKLLYFSIGIILIICIGVFFILNNNTDKKEYCNGLEWGTPLKLVDEEYSPLTKTSQVYNSYEGTCDSLDGFKSDNTIDMIFYFDDNNELDLIEANIYAEIDDAISYFVEHYNKNYKQDYTQNYSLHVYEWFGEKTNVTMTEHVDAQVLSIKYEPVVSE